MESSDETLTNILIRIFSMGLGVIAPVALVISLLLLIILNFLKSIFPIKAMVPFFNYILFKLSSKYKYLNSIFIIYFYKF